MALPESQYIWYDGKMVAWKDATTHVLTHSLHYGNAVFEGVRAYKLDEGYDSLVGVTALKNFLLNKEGKLINNTTDIPWPRTQDLEALYPINHAMFLAKREVYVEQKNRIGKKPLLHIMDELHSFDIDWPDDFIIAEIMYKNLYGKK